MTEEQKTVLWEIIYAQVCIKSLKIIPAIPIEICARDIQIFAYLVLAEAFGLTKYCHCFRLF